MIQIDFTENEIAELRHLITDLYAYYDDEEEWSFEDLDNQREIALEMAKIFDDKILEKQLNEEQI